MKRYQWFILITVVLSIISLFMEQASFTSPFPRLLSQIIDYTLMATVLTETFYEIFSAKYKRQYIRENRFSLAFTAVFFTLFIYNKFVYASIVASDLAVLAVLLRNIFIVLKIYGRMRKLSRYVENFTANPAQTILMSFIFVIMVGALILMMGFTASTGKGLSFIDALFTATSAVCVTGLVVVDTAVQYTFWGQLAIMLLIQIGGLGIMILSFFTIFMIRHRVSLADKMLLSYMLSEEDTSNIYKSLAAIVTATLIIEGLGAVLLFAGFYETLGFTWKNVFYSLFHSVSAFCNGGFALYSDSLESFRLNPLVTVTISILIILGGIGFAVISSGLHVISERIKAFFMRRKPSVAHTDLPLNTRLVFVYTGVLLLLGTIFVYLFEFSNTMKGYSLGEQYLAAFFQSVTLRTAGFNSIPFGNLREATYFIMLPFMFIGAASGSTAGGIKVNTFAVLIASLRAYLRGERKTVIDRYAVSEERVMRAFIIFFAGIVAVGGGVFIMSITEKAPFIHVLFEAVSAMGTVGISAGLTPSLSVVGKVVIMLLMFWGRLGALTIFSAATREEEKVNINWPQADISIG